MSLISSHVDKCSSNHFFSNRCTILLYALLTKFELTTLLVKDNQFTSKSLFSSVQFSHSIVSDSLQLHGLQHDRLPCPSPTPKLTQTMSIESVIPSNHLILCHPFSSCLQSFPASGFFLMSWLFTPDGQSIGVSALASVCPMNIQDWFPLGLTGWIYIQSKGLSRVFSNTTVQKHQFFRSKTPSYHHNNLVWIHLCPRMVLYTHTTQDTQEIQVQSLGWENNLEEGMATHSSILAWEYWRSPAGYSL